MLEPVGVADFEETVLRALLAAGRHTADELAAGLRAPADAVRKALLHLADLGLAAPDGPAFTAVDPGAALTGVLGERRSELDRATRAVKDLSAAFHDRVPHGDSDGDGDRGPGAEAIETIEVVRGAAAVAARFQKALSTAEREVIAFGMPPFPPIGSGGPGDPAPEISLLARRVRWRAVHALDQMAVPEHGDRIRVLASLGGQVRVVPAVPVAMTVVDRREALVTAAGGALAECAVVRQAGLCEALAALFEAAWAQATPLFAGTRGGAAAELDAADHAILQLLNAGMTDEVIGRQLGISERTVRRKVAELAARLGAGSRFQIGAQAVRRGWV